MSAAPTGLTPARAVTLVATREIRTRVRTRSFLIGNALFLVLIVGAMVLTAVLHDSKPLKVGVVGQASALALNLGNVGDSLQTTVEVRAMPTEAAARAAVLAGDLDVALVKIGSGYVAYADKSVPPTLKAVLTAAVQQRAVAGVLLEADVDPAALTRAAAEAQLQVRFEHPPRKDAELRTALALAVVVLLYFQLFSNGMTLATGVVEEKTTGVVELLLAAIRPIHLLVGKVLGIGVVGLLQLTAYGTVGMTMASVTGLLHLTGAAVTTAVGALGWYLLGYLFFGVLYAAAGSLVSRQEEVGSATAPLSVLVIAMFAVAQASVEDPGGHLSTVMSWIPPFSAILMPLRIAAGVTSPGQIVGTAALMLVTSLLLALVAGRIYQASILRTGSLPPWKRRRRTAAVPVAGLSERDAADAVV